MFQNHKTSFRPLYRAAKYCAFAMLTLIVLQIVIFVLSPPPESVLGFFELFHQNPFLGLLSLDFLYLFNNGILIVLYLAIFVLLVQEKPALALSGLILGLIGIACYYPSNPAFEMLTLSQQYFQSLPQQQSIFLAAGEAVMAGYTGTTFNAYYVFSTLCLLLFAYGILRSPQFKKSIGVWGLASGFFMIVPSSAGMLGMIFSLLSLVPWAVFVALLMAKFKELSGNSITES